MRSRVRKKTWNEDEALPALTRSYRILQREDGVGAWQPYNSWTESNLSATPQSYAKITDEIGKLKQLTTRNVSHVRVYDRPLGLDHLIYGNRKYPDVVANEYLNWRLTADHSRFVSEVDDLKSNSARDNFNARAFAAMQPDLQGEINLTNFLLELKDFKEIASVIAGRKGNLRDIVRRWKKGVRRFRLSDRKEKLSDLSKWLSGGHLTWNFAIKPFVDDVAKIYDSLRNYEQRIEEFLARRNKLQRRHYSERPTPVSENIYDAGTYSDYSYEFTGSVEYHATMVYKYDCQDLDGFWDTLRALRAILGLRLTPDVIWNAIPFSFVIDWVFRVGDWLERFNEPVIPITLEIVDYCISSKIQYETKRGFHAPPQNGGATVCFGQASNEVVIYQRRRALPSTNTFLTLTRGRFGPHQLALSLSLINSMR